MQILVPGGTHAGWRKPLRVVAKQDWRCPNCRALVRYYWSKCPVCSHPRD